MRLLETRWCDLSNPNALRFCCMYRNTKDVPSKMGPFTPEEFVEMRVALDPEKVLDEYNTRVLPQSYTLHGKPQSETLLWDATGSGIKNHADATPIRPSPTAGRFVLLCGESTMTNRVLDATKDVVLSLKREISHAGGKKWEYGAITIGRHVVKWVRTIFDKFHNAKSENTHFARLYEYIQENNSGYQWKSWAISRMPLEHGMHEVLIFITLALCGLEGKNGLSKLDTKGQEPRGRHRD
jgi:hypothetical protein